MCSVLDDAEKRVEYATTRIRADLRRYATAEPPRWMDLPGRMSWAHALATSNSAGGINVSGEDAIAAIDRKTTRTMVFYESPHRAAATMNQFAEVFGPDRPAAVVRKMTRKFEEIRRGTVEELAAFLDEQPKVRGEIVLVVAGVGVTTDLWR